MVIKEDSSFFHPTIIKMIVTIGNKSFDCIFWRHAVPIIRRGINPVKGSSRGGQIRHAFGRSVCLSATDLAEIDRRQKLAASRFLKIAEAISTP